MTQHEIVPLRCPSCGSGINEPSREVAFGAEFRCDVCGISSVLIIDRALVPLGTLQKEGEKVCLECGRIAAREARFCQEGHVLVRTCIDRYCGREFAVDHLRCDFCGRLQSFTWLVEASELQAAGDHSGAKRIVGAILGKNLESWVKELHATGDYLSAIAFLHEIQYLPREGTEEVVDYLRKEINKL